MRNRPDKRFHQTSKKVKVKTVIKDVGKFSEMKENNYLITTSALSREKIPNEDQEVTIAFRGLQIILILGETEWQRGCPNVSADWLRTYQLLLIYFRKSCMMTIVASTCALARHDVP